MATKTRREIPAPPLRPAITGPVPATMVPGRSVTIGQFIVEQINAGVDPINAAGVVGVTPAEFQGWMRDGVQHTARLHAGADWRKHFTPEQQDAVVFADQVIRAHSSHVSRLSIIAEQAARGQLPEKVTTRTKMVGPNVVEQTTTRETLLPDMDMVKWKLTKLDPNVYGDKATLNITVADLTDTDAIADLVEQRMLEVAASLTTPAIDTTATETP